MIVKFSYSMMSADGKSFYGAILVIYDREGYVGFEMLDFTEGHEWTALNQ